MTMPAVKTLAAPALAAVLILAGCGGGGDSTTTAPATGSSTEGVATAQGKESKQKTSAAKEKQQQDASSKVKQNGNAAAGTVTTPPISSAPREGSKPPAPGVKTVEGGDNSVQTYGTESSTAERTQAATTVQGYLSARADGQWDEACSYLTEHIRTQMEQFTEKVKKDGTNPGGCAGVLGTLAAKVPTQVLRTGATINEVLSFRTDGRQGFLLFEGPPGTTLYSVPMNLDGDEWKVATFSPISLRV